MVTEGRCGDRREMWGQEGDVGTEGRYDDRGDVVTEGRFGDGMEIW